MTDSSCTREHLEVLADALATPGEGRARCSTCGDHGYVYVPVRVGDVGSVSRCLCNCLQAAPREER